MNQIDPDRVVRLIRREVELYRKLLEEQEKGIVRQVEGAVDQPEVALARSTCLVDEIKDCEERLRGALDGTRLAEWIAGLQQPRRILLTGLVTQFRQVVSELLRAHRRNMSSMRTAVAHNRSMLEQVFGITSRYDASGRVSSGSVGLSPRRNLTY